MINLIPKEEKKRMTIDFYSRLAVLFLMMLDFCLIVAFISIIPAYIFSAIKESTVNTKLETQKAQPIPLLDQQTLSTINGINSKLKVVENAEKNNFSVSEKVINDIISVKMPGIKITQILYKDDSTTGQKISLEGTAPSREVLLQFSQALADSPNFKNVDLPISNFVKGANIQFSLSLTPA